MEPDTIGKLAYSAKEAARKLGLCETVVLRLIREHRLHSVRAGRRHLISEEAITRFLNDEGGSV